LAPWHTSKIVKENIRRMKLNILDWAAKPIYSKTALKERLEEEWNNIDRDLCIKLVESMPERLQNCLAAKGGHFL
jgi:hypothetical protein